MFSVFALKMTVKLNRYPKQTQMMSLYFYFSLLLVHLCRSSLLNQVVYINSSRDIGVDYQLSIDADTESLALSMEGPEGMWMGVILGKEEMFGVAGYVFYEDASNGWIFTEKYFDGLDAGELIETISAAEYSLSTLDGRSTLHFTRPWAGKYETSFSLTHDDASIQYGFARGMDGTLAYHGIAAEGIKLRSHSEKALLTDNEQRVNGYRVMDQIIYMNSSRDIGTTCTLVIDASTETMTLSMTGPQDVWMGVIFGTEHMFNASAYIYYLEGSEWILAERYLRDEVDAGDLIEIIDVGRYTVTTADGRTTIEFIRSWTGAHPTSFSLSADDTVFHYGFARGLNGSLLYHTHDLRSHLFKALKHSEPVQSQQHRIYEEAECSAIYDGNLEISALDVCTHNTLLGSQMSAKYECEDGQLYHSYFTGNDKCDGSPDAKAIVNSDGVVCSGVQSCPYSIVRVYQSAVTCDDDAYWNEDALMIDVCQRSGDGIRSSSIACDANFGLFRMTYSDETCGDIVEQIPVFPANDCVPNSDGLMTKFISCNERSETTSATTTSAAPCQDAEGQRWFITAIVFICLFGVALLVMCWLVYWAMNKGTASPKQSDKYQPTPGHEMESVDQTI